MADDTDPHRLRHLRGCHPELQWRVQKLVEALEHSGLDILLTQGVRSVAQQQALYSQGRFRPGKIVTNCDGVVKVSNHQPKDDGYGYAVDVAWRIKGRITWEGPWSTLGQLATAHGLVWGGNWKWQDLCHLELPSPVPTAKRA
jgi:peptidoglycan L-alanyl-D-glutamate endopeptidase CwlK